MNASANVASAPLSGTRRIRFLSAQTPERLWNILTYPLLLLAFTLALFLLYLVSLWLPQLPGELRTEATAAERWFASVSTPLGGAGGLLRNLGLFDVLHSLLFQGLLGVIGFLLLLQVAQTLTTIVRLRHIPKVLDRTDAVNGEPLPLLSTARLQRWRSAQAEHPLSLASQLQQLMEARFGRTERRTVRVNAPRAAVGEGAPDGRTPDGRGEPPAAADSPVLEERLLGVRGLRSVLLRPVLLVGLWLVLLLIWSNIVWGWDYTPPLLIPGERTAEIVRGVQVEYLLDEPTRGLIAPALRVRVGETVVQTPLVDALHRRVAQADLWATAAAPGLVVRSMEGGALLARPGQVNGVDSLGLGFLSSGSEETVLLPARGIGLRIVRVGRGTAGTTDDTLLVEVFRSNQEEPVDRFEVTESSVVAVPSDDGGTVALAFVPLPTLAIHMRYAPLGWVLWVALGCVLLGALGYLRRPGFLLAQIGPWPDHRSVMIIQSSLPSEMAVVRRWHGEQTTVATEVDRQL